MTDQPLSGEERALLWRQGWGKVLDALAAAEQRADNNAKSATEWAMKYDGQKADAARLEAELDRAMGSNATLTKAWYAARAERDEAVKLGKKMDEMLTMAGYGSALQGEWRVFLSNLDNAQS